MSAKSIAVPVWHFHNYLRLVYGRVRNLLVSVSKPHEEVVWAISLQFSLSSKRTATVRIKQRKYQRNSIVA